MLTCGPGICTGTAGQTALSCADGSTVDLLHQTYADGQAVGTDIFYFYFYFYFIFILVY
jgi:hypothetical protein